MRDYKTQIGGTVTIDESVEACQKFGFKPGDRIIGPCGINATVVGVGHIPGGKQNALWYARDDNEGGLSHWGIENNLRKEGFKLAQP